MTEPTTDQEPDAQTAPSPTKLRVWPAVLIAIVSWFTLTVPIRQTPGELNGFLPMLLGAIGGLLLLLIWWLFFSRVPRRDRTIGVALLVGALALGQLLLFDPTAGHFQAVYINFLPMLTAALVAVMALGKAFGVGWPLLRFACLGVIVVGFGLWSGVRHEGIDGFMQPSYAWRWTPTSEQVLLVRDGAADVSMDSVVEAAADDWPGFRGSNRDSRLTGVTIAPEWATPPREVWRTPVGPSWSSVALVGDWLYTHEQRGELECVVAYDAATGAERWSAGVAARFSDPLGGPGPRSTPEFRDGFLYVSGGTGVVRKLDAATGSEQWRRNVTDDLAVESPPEWGFAASPLVVDAADGSRLVVVYAGNPPPADDAGVADEAVVAYHAASGEVAWTAGAGYHGYCSVHLATLGGVEQLLMATNLGLESLDVATGRRLWFYEWAMGDFPRTTQPLVVDGNAVVLAAGYGYGAHRLSVTRGADDQSADDWTTATVWESRELKPYFNDYVEFDGHIYGFNGPFFTCLDAATGEPTWPKKVKRDAKFNHGQVLLVEDSAMLIAVTENSGEAVLIEATPETLKIAGRFKALDGKTWNHPVVHRGRLYLRNGSEMACFELPAQSTPRGGAGDPED
ncbi:outer membrane biogenesis protein BamB [Pseudobythopirellula maris]|uniref:Outer membrane biogenesis protein BamB n=1 Tax=Pseudobythopirellula maris TaxID=2527991 RepID=A0A5C5ZHU0_9BACT|nr:PQQ-binding-like beta-propeller repeat protein [Pseudobythopirellula maris]TWT86748.1 outer membrane biogenesis protein BamB [Pseudobythopirellula maris]